MKTFDYLGVITIEAGEALTANRFVTYDGKHTVDVMPIGVVIHDCASGNQASIAVGGVLVVYTAGTFSAGAYVKSDANGCAVENTAADIANLKKVSYMAMDAGTTGNYIRVYKAL